MVQKLSRQQLQSFLPNHEAIKAFEALFDYVYTGGPTANDAAQFAADNAQVQAGEALAQLAAIATALSQVLLAPALELTNKDTYTPPLSDPTLPDAYISQISEQSAVDVYTPPQFNGTMSSQNAENVKITGGSIANLSALGVNNSTGGEVSKNEGGTNDVVEVLNQTDAAGTKRPIKDWRKNGVTLLRLSAAPAGDSYYESFGGSAAHIFYAGGVEKFRTDGIGLNVKNRLTIGDYSCLIATSAAMFNGAGASLGTLTNAPVAGNPTKWIPINDNGTTRYLPVW